MDVSWNTLRVMALFSASILILAGCQGQDGFQARHFSATEQAKWLKDHPDSFSVANPTGGTTNSKGGGATTPVNPNKAPLTQAIAETVEGGVTPNSNTGAAAGAGAPAAATPATQSPRYTGPGAQTNLIHEGESQADLIARNMEDIKAQPSEDAKNLFPSLDLYVKPGSAALNWVVTIQGEINLDGKIYRINLDHQNVAFKLDMTNEINYFDQLMVFQDGGDSLSLKDPKTGEYRVVGSISCNEVVSCTKGFVVRFDVKIKGAPVSRVIFVQNDGSDVNTPNALFASGVRPPSYLEKIQKPAPDKSVVDKTKPVPAADAPKAAAEIPKAAAPAATAAVALKAEVPKAAAPTAPAAAAPKPAEPSYTIDSKFVVPLQKQDLEKQKAAAAASAAKAAAAPKAPAPTPAATATPVAKAPAPAPTAVAAPKAAAPTATASLPAADAADKGFVINANFVGPLTPDQAAKLKASTAAAAKKAPSPLLPTPAPTAAVVAPAKTDAAKGAAINSGAAATVGLTPLAVQTTAAKTSPATN